MSPTLCRCRLGALWWIALAAAAAPHLACSEVECGPGTHREGNQCLSSLNPQCGPGTELEGGFCVPNAGGAECGPGTHLEGSVCTPNLAAEGNVGRFNDAVLLAPPMLSEIGTDPLAQSLAEGDNLLFIGLYAPTAGTMRLYGGPGMANQDGTFTLLGEGAFDTTATVDGELVQSEPFVFNFPAFGTAMLPLEATTFTEVVIENRDGVAIPISGRFEGVITPSNAGALFIEITGQTLLDLLTDLGEAPDIDYDPVDGTNESWRLSATFATEPVWLF